MHLSRYLDDVVVWAPAKVNLFLEVLGKRPDGYHEISRTHLIKPTSPPQNSRELVNVNWMYPAYANRHIYARNDEEIICASLAADGR